MELSDFVKNSGLYNASGDGGTIEDVVRTVVEKMIADGSLTGGLTSNQIDILESATDAFETAKNDMAFRTAEGANSANTYISIMRNLIDELRK